MKYSKHKMDFKQIAAIHIKKRFCSKTDEELSEYLINQLVNDNDNSTFKKSIPTEMSNKWIIILQLLSGKRIFLPRNNINEHSKSILLELQLKYKNSSHEQLEHIRYEFSNFIDNIKC